MLWALVMAGGRGTRLWPLSRRARPKPLLKLVPGQATLLEETIRRIRPHVPAHRIWVIGNHEHLSGLRRCASQIPRSQIIGEPVSRNTAATVGLAASFISKRDPHALLLTLPADHWIASHKGFQKAVETAARISKRTGSFSIFGVPPRFPSPSYGYLRAGRNISRSVYELRQFVEKPSAKRARSFLRRGRFFWHAGIFLAPAKAILSSLKRFAPSISDRLMRIRVRHGEVIPPKEFRALPNVSFDYAVLEKLEKAYLIACDFDWCDVGTWKAFETLWPKDRFQNAVVGSCFALNSRRNIIYSKNKMVCLQGVKDLVVIDTLDALLVGAKDSAEEMRNVVVHLSQSKKGLARYS